VNELTQILQVIEFKRNEMHQATERYGLLSRMVLVKSQELHLLLNQYQLLIK
jgi:hypothetical protein